MASPRRQAWWMTGCLVPQGALRLFEAYGSFCGGVVGSGVHESSAKRLRRWGSGVYSAGRGTRACQEQHITNTAQLSPNTS